VTRRPCLSMLEELKKLIRGNGLILSRAEKFPVLRSNKREIFCTCAIVSKNSLSTDLFRGGSGRR
jgi:hypothetical protein